MAVIVFAPPRALGLGRLGEYFEEEFFVESSELALGGDGQQLVGEIHQDAVVSCGVIGERDAKLAGHEGGIAGGCEEVIEAREQLIARGVIEHEAGRRMREPRGSNSAVRSRSGKRASPAKTTQRSCLGVELLAGQDAKLVENGGEGFLRFVDDEHGSTARGKPRDRPSGHARL